MVRLALCVVLLAGLSGCGGEEFATAVVKGRVTCNDQPVPGGTLTFVPVPDERTTNAGPGGTASINPDGTYETRAVIGPVNVVFSRPSTDDIPELEEAAKGTGEAAEDAKAELEMAKKLTAVRCNAAEREELEIKDGENVHDIELIFQDPREFD
jgi:hypothetical protein